MLRSIGHIEVMTTLFYENTSKQKSLPENENDFFRLYPIINYAFAKAQ